jgi:hypothetical protein
MTNEDIKLFMDLLDKFLKLSYENQTTLNLVLNDLKKLEESVGKSDATIFSLLHRLMAEKKSIEETHKKLLDFIDTFSKRNYTEAELAEIGGPLQEIYKLSENSTKQKELECTEKILETHDFIASIKKRWKWIVTFVTVGVFVVTFAEKIVKFILYLHKLLGG